MTVLLNLTHDELNKDNKILCQIVGLEKTLFVDGWSKGAILSVLSQFGVGVLIVLQNHKVIGYCIYSIVFELAEVLRIAICPDFQRQGIGKMLLNETCQFAKDKNAERILLEVRSDNIKAIGLYQNQGFCHIDTRPCYYDNQVDALILQRDLLC